MVTTLHRLTVFHLAGGGEAKVVRRSAQGGMNRGGVAPLATGAASITSITTVAKEHIIGDKATDRAAAMAVSWAYSENYLPLDDVMLSAQQRANELGCPYVSPGTGALLSVLATGLHATAVAEIGTGAGVSGLWLLRGMGSEGVLTTIDSEAEHLRAAKEAFAAEEIRPTRARTITGRALEVLPRLSDSAYDMVLADADPLEAGEYVEHATRILRPGGLLVVPHALNDDQVADPAMRDPLTVAMRQLGRLIREDERLRPVLIPLGDGVLVAARVA